MTFTFAAFAQAAFAQNQSVAGAPASGQAAPLFLHFFTPTYYLPKGAQPPRRIVTAKVRLGDDFDIHVGEYSDGVSGRVEARDGKYFAHLNGAYGTSVGYCEQEVQLEQPFAPKNYLADGGIFLTYFVLSTNADCKPFLAREAAAEKAK